MTVDDCRFACLRLQQVCDYFFASQFFHNVDMGIMEETQLELMEFPIPSYENVMSSPHGTDQHDISLPSDFKSSQQCLDETVIGDRKLCRKIQLSAWSQKVTIFLEETWEM